MIEAIEAKGAEVEASLPEDYTSALEKAKYHAPAIICDVSDSVVAVNDAAERELLIAASELKATVDGTPDFSTGTITTITPVQASTLTRSGTNIFNIAADFPHGYSSNKSTDVTLTRTETGIILTTNKDYTGSWVRFLMYIGKRSELAGQTITLTADYTSSVVADTNRMNYGICMHDKKGGYIAVDTTELAKPVQSGSATGTVPETGPEYVYAMLYLGYGYTAPSGSTVEWSNIRVNIGSTDLGYEPYTGQTLTSELPEAIYGGQLDWTTGLLTVTHRLVDADSQTWKLSTTAEHRAVTIVRQAAIPACSHYPRGGVAVPYCYFRSSASQIVLQDPSLTTLEDFTAFFAAQKAAGTPVQFLIEELPENQTTIQLTPQQLTMLKGKNVLFSDSGTTAITYAADTKLYIDNALAAIAASVIHQ